MKYFIDMDEVLVDLNSSVFKFYNVTPTLGEWEQIPGKTEAEILEDIDTFEFWRDLPKMPWADNLINFISNNCTDWAFLSCPTLKPESWAGKSAWIKIHYPQHINRLVLTREKFRLASPHHCLIDDRKNHLEKFKSRGGNIIPFPSRNGHFDWSEAQMNDPLYFVEENIRVVQRNMCRDTIGDI